MPTSSEGQSIVRGSWSLWLHAAVAIAMVAALRLEDRLWWCACGTGNLWSSDVWGPHNSQHLIDPYAFTHLLHGVGFWWILRLVAARWPVWWQSLATAVLEAAWEVWENSPFIIERYRQETAAQGYLGDTVLNSIGDLLSCLAGFWIAQRIGWRWSIALFVVTEIVLALWIRDGLILNILMLIWPIEAIKAWQMPAS